MVAFVILKRYAGLKKLHCLWITAFFSLIMQLFFIIYFIFGLNMLDFTIYRDESGHPAFLETSLCGKPLLTTPQLNKGTAFTWEERLAFGLLGKLPHHVETLEEQVQRAYLQYLSYTSRLQQNIYLNNLHDKNQILFYKLLSTYLSEMLPTIYTPIVGVAAKRFSQEYRQPRGLYIAHTDKELIPHILSNRSNPDIDLIVITDGEGVLGIGDQGIGGMDIPVAKLMVYSLCGGIDPIRTLPIFLDVGTNNQQLLDDPLYLGCRHPRINTEQYDDFVKTFVLEIHQQFPNAFLHWEDFGRDNARRMLDMWQDELCTFNDDIQGTGAVTLAALLAACQVTGLPLEKNRIIIFGAGSAGMGICDQLVDDMINAGYSREEACQHFWLFDRQGLVLETDASLTKAQEPYARKASEVQQWFGNNQNPQLAEAIHHIKPTILIGCSAQTGAFTGQIIQDMAGYCDRPIIFPISNPDEKCEAKPLDLLTWTDGKALIATGTAFPDVTLHGKKIRIAQCNNALVFPGIGLGILAVKPTKLTREMILAAAAALSKQAPSNQDSFAPLLPSLDEAQTAAKNIAIAVAKVAIDTGFAQCNQDKNLEALIDTLFWKPHYLPFKYRKMIAESDK